MHRITDRSSEPRRRYERALVVLYQCEPSTREVVIDAFRPLAANVARRYQRGEEPLDDLTQVALFGLLKALERFDTDRGSPFVLFALPTMTGEIRRHFRDTGWAVHVTRGDQELAQRIAALERSTGEHLSPQQIAARLDISVEQVVSGQLVRGAMRADSLDRPIAEDDAQSAARLDPAHDEPGYTRAEHRTTISVLTRDLSAREREILARRFGRGETQSEIGDRIGISQMHVSRLLRRTLEDLRTTADDDVR